jgi:uncharacterized membrane protein YsdA (DUF1294 family)
MIIVYGNSHKNTFDFYIFIIDTNSKFSGLRIPEEVLLLFLSGRGGLLLAHLVLSVAVQMALL